MLNKKPLLSSTKCISSVLTVNNHFQDGVSLFVKYLDKTETTELLVVGINTFFGVSEIRLSSWECEFSDTPVTPNTNIELSNSDGRPSNFKIARVIDTSKDAYVNIFVD